MEEEYIEIAKIDKNKYASLCENDILTDEVVITYKQIMHINEERMGVYDKYKNELKNIIENPDYIIEDTKHKETGLVIKTYDKNVVLVLRLNTSEKNKKNSIITIWEIKQKRLERYLLTHRYFTKKNKYVKIRIQ